MSLAYLLLGILGVWIAVTVLRNFTQADPATLSRMVQKGAGFFVIGAALSMLLSGKLAFAFLLAVLGFWLLGTSRPADGWFSFVNKRWFAFAPFGLNRSIRSKRSKMIEIILDEAGDPLQGYVRGGEFAGRGLDELTYAERLSLHEACQREDADGMRLLEAYLNRWFPGWRQAGEGNADAGRGRGSGNHGIVPDSGPMTEDMAYEILGLRKQASRDEIVKAHRTLMQKLHPDHGGSTHLAARVNEAKDVLLRRHT